MGTTFAGQTAIVTGASRGIGRGIAEKLAAEGASVVVNYRFSRERAEEVVETICASGGDAVAIGADVSEYKEVSAMVDATVEEFGSLDVLINNAGIVITDPAETFDVDEWRRVIDVNLVGTFICSRLAAERMIEASGGSIVNVSSMMGGMGFELRSPYCAAKAGVNNLTRTLAVEWADADISVNALAPGFVYTDITDETKDAAGYTDVDIRRRTPMRRYGTVEEMANCAVFLARGDTFVTGEVLHADGGWTADAWRYREYRA